MIKRKSKRKSKKKLRTKKGDYSYTYYYKKPKLRSQVWHNKISVTLILIILNVVAYFVLMAFGFFSFPNPADQHACEETICRYVALQPSSIIHGKYLWTIITSMFAHGSLVHLFVNMLSLFFLGSFLEKLIGKKKFLAVYFISGIIASLFFVLFALKPLNSIPAIGIPPESFAVGASGAIFGLGGLLAVLTPRIPVFILFIPIAMPLWFGILLMFAVLCIITALAGLPIGNAAHLGGLILGLAYGFYIRFRYKKKIALLDRYFRFRR